MIRILLRITPRAPLRKQRCRFVENFLPCSRDSVYVTQAISERPHHVRGEVRRLLNEKMEPPSVDLSQATRGLRDGGGSTRAVVNQCHLPNQCALPYRFEYEIAK
jgi:hypothetical protein